MAKPVVEEMERALQKKAQQEAEQNERLGKGIAKYALHMASKGETERILSRASVPRFRLVIAGRPVFDDSVFGRSEIYPAAAYETANAVLAEQGLAITPPRGIDADFMARMDIVKLEQPRELTQS